MNSKPESNDEPSAPFPRADMREQLPPPLIVKITIAALILWVFAFFSFLTLVIVLFFKIAFGS